MDSNSSSQSGASTKDCRTCMLRRIRCDRSLPRCRKCSKHQRECPGYGLNIRWTTPSTEKGRKRKSPKPVRPVEAMTNSTATASTHPMKSWTEARELLALLIPDVPLENEIRSMVHHYRDAIAGKMVWVDTEENPYRRIVIPLSKTQPVLLLAILTVSAEHKALSQSTSSDFARRAHDVVIDRITQNLQAFTDGSRGVTSPTTMDLGTAEWILASILILSNYECIRPESSAWRFHRQGARVLINTVTTLDVSLSELFDFLRNQFAIFDVFASTTTQRYMTLDDVILPASDSDTMFSQYLLLLHGSHLHQRRPQEASSNFMSPAELRIKFDLARGSTLLDAGRACEINRTIANDFICLVELYHHAALIYTYQCAYGYTSSNSEMKISISVLFEKLRHFPSLNECAHNMAWPVFVAGVSCHEVPERQQLVSNLFRTLLKETGFNNYGSVVSFLETFWTGNEPDWLKVVEAWEAQGRYLLVVI